jgi:CRP-like cAMP-binding protein
MDLQEALSGLAWFRGLPAEHQQVVARTTLLRRVVVGEYVARRGFVASHWIGVAKGLLKASTSTAEGRQISEILASTGEWTGEVEILLERRRPYDVVALEPSTLLLVSARTFRWLVAHDIGFANLAMRYLATRNAAAMDRFERPRQTTGIAAVASAIAELLARVMRCDADCPYPIVRLSQGQIAEIVRLSRQTVNQGLKFLEERGLIRVGYQRIEVRDESGLRGCIVFNELSELRQMGSTSVPSIQNLLTPEA